MLSPYAIALITFWIAGIISLIFPPTSQAAMSSCDNPGFRSFLMSATNFYSSVVSPALYLDQDTVENPPVLETELLAQSVPDSLPPDSLEQSSTPAPKEEGIDTTISYWADDIDFDVLHRTTTLTGHARIRYKTMTLEAAWIMVDWNANLMTAGGTLDTLFADSARSVIDTVMWVGHPVYTDGGEIMEGDQILYNYKTKKGRVLKGKTQYLDGYYWGSRIKRVEENTFYVGKGTFTTCDQNDPHYHFWSQDMKMIVNDKIVARPIVMYFQSVPIGIIPYGIFPNRRGRHSGILIPYYGETGASGRFLKDIGYYFAISDYMDLISSFDYYERYGFLGRGEFRYRVRYLLDGSVRGSFVRQDFEERRDRRWDLSATHNQTIDPWTQLRVNLNLVSDNSYYTQTSTNLADRLNKTIYSDATLTHSWAGTPSSVSLNLHHEQNLETNSFSQTLPRIQYRHSQTRIISPPVGNTEDQKWYHSLYWNYSAEGLNRRTATNTAGDRWRGGVRHIFGFNSPQNVLRYLTITPNFNATEDWFAEWLNYGWENNALVSDNRDQLRQRFTYSLGVGANTKLYGIFLDPFGVGADFRHTMTPQISLTYRPDFSEPGWGYYGSLQIPDSTVYTWDKFSGNVFAATPVGEQRTVGLGLTNLFQMKRTTEDQVVRTDLFNLDFSTSYNFAAEQFPWSNLSTSFRTTPISGGGIGPLKSLSLDLTTSHSFYQEVGGTQIDRFVFQDFTWSNPELVRLLSSTIGASLRFSGGGLTQTTALADTTPFPWQASIAQDTTQMSAAPSESTSGWDLGHIPWELNLSGHYSVNNAANTRYAQLNGSLDFDLTANWKIGYSAVLNLVDGSIVSTGITIYRDLHCWEGRFIWNPVGLGEGYFLRISVKSPQLQDLKLEKQRGYTTFSGF